MCQIFAGKSNKIRTTLLETPGLLADLYDSNSDGIGAMYATSKNVLRTPKIVPANLASAHAFVAQLPDDDRNLVLHFRMRTSGNTDQNNAHPFCVLPGQMAMTHNGVLSISTKDDPTQCDTRHYIAKVIKPQVEVAPSLAYVDQWLDLIGDDIGSGNRFVFMNNRGEMSFVNRQTGIELEDMWIANTYSFKASLLVPGFKDPVSWRDQWDKEDDTLYGGRGVSYGRGSYLSDYNEIDPEDIWEALSECDIDAIDDVIYEFPVSTFVELFDNCRFEPHTEAMSDDDEAVCKLLADEDIKELVERCRTMAGSRVVAQVIGWYGDWVGKSVDEKTGSKDKHEASLKALEMADTNDTYAG